MLEEYALPRERPDIPSTFEYTAIRIPLPVAVEYLYDLQQREEEVRPGLYTHFTSNTDCSQNPYLTPVDSKSYPAREDDLFFPDDEDEFVREVYREGVYREGGIEGDCIKDATTRVKRRVSGDRKWDDLVDFMNWGCRCT
jgi:hypothetical protein